MTVRLSLEVSTQVTKSSMCLGGNKEEDLVKNSFNLPGDEKCGVSDGIWSDAHMALLDEFCSLGRMSRGEEKAREHTDCADRLCHF
jgi:hypothetical protein